MALSFLTKGIISHQEVLNFFATPYDIDIEPTEITLELQLACD